MEENLKQLLLQDLSSRLPYGVKCYIEFDDGKIFKERTLTPIMIQDFKKSFMLFKPYLRTMSSMTEEEKKEYEKICELDTEILANHPMNGEPFPSLYNSQDWLNKYHFDYRGLIPKGLALKAPEGMYN